MSFWVQAQNFLKYPNFILYINLSFVNVKVKNGKIIKTSWRTLEVTGATTAQHIVDAVYKSLADAFIPKLNLVTITPMVVVICWDT